MIFAIGSEFIEKWDEKWATPVDRRHLSGRVVLDIFEIFFRLRRESRYLFFVQSRRWLVVDVYSLVIGRNKEDTPTSSMMLRCSWCDVDVLALLVCACARVISPLLAYSNAYRRYQQIQWCGARSSQLAKIRWKSLATKFFPILQQQRRVRVRSGRSAAARRK